MSGRRVLIAGAAGGLGAAIARGFAADGARLTLADLDRAAAETLAADLRSAGAEAQATEVDISDEASVAAMTEAARAQLGGLDVAVNAAGVLHAPARLVDLDLATFDQAMAVNARGAFLCLRAWLRTMIESETSGAIVTLSSVAGLVGAPTLSAYTAAKHAVVGLTRTAADEAARHGIRVNALCPSFAETGMLDALGAAAEDPDRLTRRIPLRRLVTPPEVAAAALWLASDDNRFMTGQAIALDGGLTAV